MRPSARPIARPQSGSFSNARVMIAATRSLSSETARRAVNSCMADLLSDSLRSSEGHPTAPMPPTASSNGAAMALRGRIRPMRMEAYIL